MVLTSVNTGIRLGSHLLLLGQVCSQVGHRFDRHLNHLPCPSGLHQEPPSHRWSPGKRW